MTVCHSSHRLLLAALLAPLLLAGPAACKPSPPDAGSEAGASAAAADSAPIAAAGAAMADAADVLNPLHSPKEVVQGAMRRFATLKSYHARMQLDGGAQGSMTNSIDFVAPDRFRMTMPELGTQTIIGDTMYMSVGGRSMKVPLPAGTLSKWRDPAKLEANAATMTVQAQGSDDIDGIAARKYLVHNTTPQPSDVTMWIGPDDLPLQIRVSASAKGQDTTTTIRYSRFDDAALQIDPPH